VAIGIFVQMLLTTVLSHLVLDGRRHRFHLDSETLGEVRRFSQWVILSTALMFFATQFDRLVFARFFPLNLVGLYSIAAGLAGLIPTLLGRLGGSILLPLYARILARDGNLIDVFRRTSRPALTITSYMVTLLIAGAPAFVALVYDKRYTEAALFIQILAAGSWFSSIDCLYGSAFIAANHVRYVMLVNMAKVVSFCLFLVVAIVFHNIIMAVLAVAVSEVVRLSTSMILSRRLNLATASVDRGMLLLSILVAAASVPAAEWAGQRYSGHPLTILCFVFAGITAVYSRQLLSILHEARASHAG
jgi:O-antigen/teichoic acid export membrane protein